MHLNTLSDRLAFTKKRGKPRRLGEEEVNIHLVAIGETLLNNLVVVD